MGEALHDGAAGSSTGDGADVRGTAGGSPGGFGVPRGSHGGDGGGGGVAATLMFFFLFSPTLFPRFRF